ncbi:hypothetical protein GJAV_G00163740 [Gymnothorax javanicus]|nr:hypothetical protein GJAV_G00163740 [Gymnothorax javanicus]
MPPHVQTALANTVITEPRALAEEADRFLLATERFTPEVLAPTRSYTPMGGGMLTSKGRTVTDAASDVARAFIGTWVTRFSTPSDLSSDCGSQFTSELWNSVAGSLGVKLHRTTAYHPQANGLHERFHHSIKAALHASLTDGNWVDRLPWVMLGIRCAPKEDLQSSSADFVYGQTLQVSGDFIPDATVPWSAARQCSSLLEAAEAFAPVPTSQHGTPAFWVPPNLRSANFVFIHHDAPPYDGPFRVLQHGDKGLVVDVGGRPETVSIDGVKPAHMDVSRPWDPHAGAVPQGPTLHRLSGCPGPCRHLYPPTWWTAQPCPRLLPPRPLFSAPTEKQAPAQRLSMRDYDEITAFLGEWGPFQRTVSILLSLSTIPNGYSAMCMVFLGDTPRHHCSLPYLNSTEYNQSQALPREEVNGQLDYSQCTRYKRLNGTDEVQFGNETETCVDGWDYDTEQYISTITTEWDLVCADAWKVPFSLSVFFMGVLSGSLLCGQISDRFGRKPILFLCMATQTVFTLIQVVSVSWEMFAIFYFISGIGQISNYLTAFILGNEVLGESYRSAFSTMGMCVFYSVGYVILPLFAYFIRSWRMLLLVLALPGFLYMPLWWFIPESPRWLLAQGRVKEAEAIIRAAAKKNGVTAPVVIFREEDSSRLSGNKMDHVKTSFTYLDLVRTRNIRSITILSVFIWFSISICYFGLSLSTPSMSGNPYFNCLLSAVAEVVAYIGAWLLLKVASRRLIISSTLLVGGSVLLLTQVVPKEFNSFIVGLVMVGKLVVTAAFAVLYISAMELYPTVVRGMGVGICSLSSKIGSMTSPFLVFMGTYNNALPYIVMGLLALAMGLLSLLIPETRGIVLPEDLSQVQAVKCCCHRGKPTMRLEVFEDVNLPAEDESSQISA